MGSRFGGLKQVEPVGPAGETVLDYSVFDAVRAGFGKVVFVIRREMEGVFQEAVLSRFEGRIPCALAYQEIERLPRGFTVPAGRTKPWGTAHAIACAAGEVGTPFLAINADDFYGADSFRQMGAFLSESAGAGPGAPLAFAMAGFRLGNTLSEFGGVARGVCEVDGGGFLTGIEEVVGIERHGARIAQRQGDGTLREFMPGQPVSMNFWGFRPELFPLLERGFRAFLELRGHDPKSEYYIPAAVFDLIRRGECTVRVLPVEGEWFGVTFREDRPRVVAAIRERVDAGEYPSPLWG